MILNKIRYRDMYTQINTVLKLVLNKYLKNVPIMYKFQV